MLQYSVGADRCFSTQQPQQQCWCFFHLVRLSLPPSLCVCDVGVFVFVIMEKCGQEDMCCGVARSLPCPPVEPAISVQSNTHSQQGGGGEGGGGS